MALRLGALALLASVGAAPGPRCQELGFSENLLCTYCDKLGAIVSDLTLTVGFNLILFVGALQLDSQAAYWHGSAGGVHGLLPRSR